MSGRISDQPVLLRTDTLMDGRSEAAVAGELLIQDGRIAAMGPPGTVPLPAAVRRIDVTGCVVCPGFIDLHTHSDVALLEDGRGQSQICQGVTLEVVGNCGHSLAPLPDAAEQRHGLTLGPQLREVPCWRDMAGFLEAIDAARPSLNVAALVGHGTLRRACLSDPRVPVPDAAGQSALERALAAALEAGAVGMSTGLEYDPGIHAQQDEIDRLCRIVAQHGALYTTHLRNRDRLFESAMQEALSTAELTGVGLQISHITPKYGAPENAAVRMREMVDQARSHGVDVAYDVIPHHWGPTITASVLPAWALVGGTRATLERLRDPRARERIRQAPNPIWPLVRDRRWNDIVMFDAIGDPSLNGISMAEIGRSRNQDPFDSVLDILIAAGESLYSVTWVGRNFAPADTALLLDADYAGVISDAITLSHDGPFAGLRWSPSACGWVARYLAWCRDGVLSLSLPEAVRRLTTVPANRLGLSDRGQLRPGACADLVVFDPAAVNDRSTLAEPHRSPEGFHQVWVNGVQVVANGCPTGRRPGRALRAVCGRVH